MAARAWVLSTLPAVFLHASCEGGGGCGQPCVRAEELCPAEAAAAVLELVDSSVSGNGVGFSCDGSPSFRVLAVHVGQEPLSPPISVDQEVQANMFPEGSLRGHCSVLATVRAGAIEMRAIIEHDEIWYPHPRSPAVPKAAAIDALLKEPAACRAAMEKIASRDNECSPGHKCRNF